MKIDKKKYQKIKKILLVRPHYFPVKEIIKISSQLKCEFPEVRIVFTANKKNLLETDLVLINNSSFINKSIFFSDKNKSPFWYLRSIKREKLDLIFIPFFPDFREISYKSLIKLILLVITSGASIISIWNLWENKRYDKVRGYFILESMFLWIFRPKLEEFFFQFVIISWLITKYKIRFLKLCFSFFTKIANQNLWRENDNRD